MSKLKWSLLFMIQLRLFVFGVFGDLNEFRSCKVHILIMENFPQPCEFSHDFSPSLNRFEKKFPLVIMLQKRVGSRRVKNVRAD